MFGTIFLSHRPWQAEKAAKAGADLMLSGHTHGGQIWPFGYLVRRRYPLLAGRYTVNGMTVIVSRGTGTWGPRMRLWRPGEIVRLTLRGGKKRVPVMKNGQTDWALPASLDAFPSITGIFQLSTPATPAHGRGWRCRRHIHFVEIEKDIICLSPFFI